MPFTRFWDGAGLAPHRRSGGPRDHQFAHVARRSGLAVDTFTSGAASALQADRAIVAATVMRRLLSTGCDGIGAGAADQKGWLPSVSLRLAGADPGVDVGSYYLVQRGGGKNDLTVLDDAWRPLRYGHHRRRHATVREPPRRSECKAFILTLTLSVRGRSAQAAYRHGRGEVVAGSSSVCTRCRVMMSTDGDGSLFDGANASADSAVEDPTLRPLLSRYNDIVLERSIRVFWPGCTVLPDRLHQYCGFWRMTLFYQVDDLKTGNIAAADKPSFAAGSSNHCGGYDERFWSGIANFEQRSRRVGALCCGFTELATACRCCCSIPQLWRSPAVCCTQMASSVGLNVVAPSWPVMRWRWLIARWIRLLSCRPLITLYQALNAAKSGTTQWRLPMHSSQRSAVETNELNTANVARTMPSTIWWRRCVPVSTSTSIDSRIQPVLMRQPIGNPSFVLPECGHTAARQLPDGGNAVDQSSRDLCRHAGQPDHADYSAQCGHRCTGCANRSHH